jgi:hypothetical protein
MNTFTVSREWEISVRRKEAISRRAMLTELMAAATLGAIPGVAGAQTQKTTALVGEVAQSSVPLDYVGLSYESMQLADSTFFSADNAGLISLFRSLSMGGVLRIGGNSSEFCWWKARAGDRPAVMPSPARGAGNWMPQHFTAIEPVAIDRLAGFLDATSWKAIYGLNLGTGTPESDAAEAAYVAKTLGSRLLFFQIGNEPEYYSNANNGLRPAGWNFDRYFEQWITFARAVIARVPDALFGGPDVGSNAEWVVRFAEEASKCLQGRIVACTGHYYAEGPPDSPTTTVARLLTPDTGFQARVARMTAAASESGMVYRMTEGNSCYRGGKPGLSNAFCSALWVVEFMLNLASEGAAGVNLHGGGSKQIRLSLGGHLPGEHLTPDAAKAAAEGSFYTPIAGSREKGFIARPILYGMKLAGLLAGGKMRPVKLSGRAEQTGAWAADMPDGGTRMVILNKDARQELEVEIPATRGAKLWRMEGPGLTATSGVMLAGATIDAGEDWKPRREEHLTRVAGRVRLTLGAASGAAIFL